MIAEMASGKISESRFATRPKVEMESTHQKNYAHGLSRNCSEEALIEGGYVMSGGRL